MCGRYHIETEDRMDEIREILDEINRKYNGTDALAAMKTGEIRPTNTVPVIGKDGPELMTWSYYNQNAKRAVINARIDNPVWGSALRANHVAIPTSGFYEWTHPGGKTGEKYLFLPPHESVLYLAGIFVHHAAEDGRKERRFLILTTDPNESMTKYHDRMPLYLRRDEIDTWVNDSSATEGILHRAQPQYVASLAEPPKPQQMSLF